MTSPSPEESRQPAPDDTAAFQRFYNQDATPAPERGWVYRLLVGWWRDRA